MTYRPTSNFKRWTSEEDQILRDMISRGKNSAQIAKFLGRTRVSIFARKSKLGIDAKMSPARGSEMPYTHGTKTRNGNHKGRVKGSGKSTPSFTPPANTNRVNVTPRTSRASLGAHLDALMATAKQAGIKVSVSFTSEDTNTNWL
jgi:hypothetical protein